MKRSAFHEVNKLGSFFRRLVIEKNKLAYINYRLRWNLLPRLSLVSRFPTHIDIETTNRCNLRCVMCPHSFPTQEFKKTLRSADQNLVYQIIDEGALKGLCSVKMFFRGEPLIDSRLPDFISYAKKKGVREVSINTNGQLLTEAFSLKLINSGLDLIVIAVDGNSSQTYNNIRIGGDFDILVNNIDMLLRLKKEHNNLRPIVRLQFLKVDTNRQEIKGFLERWKNKVDSLSIKDCTERGSDKSRLTGEGYVKVSRLPCPQLWQRLTITAGGEVLMCCRDWDCENTIGILDYGNNVTIEKLWKSKELNRIRKAHLLRQLESIGICRKCTYKESFNWAEKKER